MDENGFYNSPSPENFYPGGLIICSGPRIRVVVDYFNKAFWPGTKSLESGGKGIEKIVNTSVTGLLIERAKPDVERWLNYAHNEGKEPFQVWKVLMNFEDSNRGKLWWFVFSNTLFESYELLS